MITPTITDRHRAIALAATTYHESRRGPKMVGYRILHDLNLLDQATTLARLAVSVSPSGSKLGNTVMRIGSAIGSKTGNDLTLRQQLAIGGFMVSAMTKAGLYEIVLKDGAPATSRPFKTRESYYIQAVGYQAADKEGYMSTEPFPPWLEPTDDDGRTLVSNRHYQPTDMAQPWVAAVNHLEVTQYSINNQILDLINAIDLGNLYTHEDSKTQATKIRTTANQWRDKSFYTRASVDLRGRLYLSSAPLNFQQGDIARALLQFAEPVALTAAGMDAIYLHLANMDGSIKGSMAERIAGAKANHNTYISYAKDPLGTINRWLTAGYDQPLQVIRGSLELLTAKVGHPSHLIVEIDQTQSALQWIAIFMEDQELAKQVGLQGPAGDLYVRIGSALGLPDTVDPWELRTLAKKIVMPKGYGAGAKRLAIQLTDWAQNEPKAVYTKSLGGFRDNYEYRVEVEGRARAVRVFDTESEAKALAKTNDSYKVVKHKVRAKKSPPVAVVALAQAGIDAIEKVAPSAAKYQEAVQGWAAAELHTDAYLEFLTKWVSGDDDPLAKFNLEKITRDRAAPGYVGPSIVKWRTPGGFNVHYEIYNTKELVGSVQSWANGEAHRLQPVFHKDTIYPDHRKMIRSSFSGLIHSYDAALLHLYLSTIDYPAVTIHDAVGVHANNVVMAQRQLTDKLIELEATDPLMLTLHGGYMFGEQHSEQTPNSPLAKALVDAGLPGSTTSAAMGLPTELTDLFKRQTSVINPDHTENFS